MSNESGRATEEVRVVEADLARTDHAAAVLEMVNAYSMDPMGSGAPLAVDVRRELIPRLRAHPTTIIFLAYQADRLVGVAVCFLGFSTFAARPIINVHDLAVLTDCRGQGVGRQLLAAVERKARKLDCCKLTLEVQENNHTARRTYEAAGFRHSLGAASHARSQW